MTQGAIWIGDTQLTKFAVLPTGNRLPVQSIEDSFVRSTFDHPLALFGTVLVHVRRPDGRAGVVVTAIDADSGKVLWNNELAMPPAATPIVDEANRTLAFADVNGLVYRFDDAAMRSRVQDQPLSAGPAQVGNAEADDRRRFGRGPGRLRAPGESEPVAALRSGELAATDARREVAEHDHVRDVALGEGCLGAARSGTGVLSQSGRRPAARFAVSAAAPAAYESSAISRRHKRTKPAGNS